MKLLELSKHLGVSREIIMRIVKDNCINIEIKYNNRSQEYYYFNEKSIEKIKLSLNDKPNKTKFKKF